MHADIGAYHRRTDSDAESEKNILLMEALLFQYYQTLCSSDSHMPHLKGTAYPHSLRRNRDIRYVLNCRRGTPRCINGINDVRNLRARLGLFLCGCRNVLYNLGFINASDFDAGTVDSELIKEFWYK